MRKAGIVLGLVGSVLVSSAFAIDAHFIAKSTKPGDKGYMTAEVTTLTGSDGKTLNGVFFKAFDTDGDRMDSHCSKVVIKMESGEAVFVANMMADDLNKCFFHEHSKKAGPDSEKGLETKAKFVPAN